LIIEFLWWSWLLGLTGFSLVGCGGKNNGSCGYVLVLSKVDSLIDYSVCWVCEGVCASSSVDQALDFSFEE